MSQFTHQELRDIAEYPEADSLEMRRIARAALANTERKTS